MSVSRLPVVSIIGPTAVGKTQLSLDIARNLNAEIISVDSRQIYRYLDIGTDKISPQERKEVIHHLIDVADPDEVFTVMDFIEQAAEAANRITRRGKRVLFVGGTPFYYHALFKGSINPDLPCDQAVRREIEERFRENGKDALFEELRRIDAETAGRLHPNDTRRIIRALEIYELTGNPPSRCYQEARSFKSPFSNLYIGLNRPRSELYDNIDLRVRKQFSNGYVEEVKWLLNNSFPEDLPSLQGFGYREIVELLKGNLSMEEAIISDIKATKAFSRRQMTWFRKFSPIMWYDTSVVSPGDIRTQVISMCEAHYEEAQA